MKNKAIVIILKPALLLLTLVCSLTSIAANPDKKETDKSNIEIMGRIKDALSRKDLLQATVYLSDSTGCLIDSTKTGGWFYGMGRGNINERAMFRFNLPRREATYYLEVVMPEYQNLYFTLDLNKIGRREYSRTLPDMLMQRAPKQLDGVTVTVSKVKFYNKGDTLVFNADAFELAEGSMLDALIKQLPGVELKEGGQIFVNGEFVENLLLNGKDFFKGKNELMLDNLSSYTVKNVEVYRRSSDLQKWAGDKAQSELVMDVKLKHEYNMGWIMNFEAGGGTSERYMARAFINRFTNNSRVSIIGNINNLNDNRKPGESSTWTPETNTAGTMKTQLGGLDYYVQEADERWKVNGDATVRHSSQTDIRETNRLNFLGADRTYDYSFLNNHTRNLAIATSHSFMFSPSSAIFMRGSVNGDYNKTRSRMSNLSGAFYDERPNMTMGMLDTLYSGNPAALADIINRTRVSTLNSSHSENLKALINGGVKVFNTSDYIFYSLSFGYSSSKSEVWRDYTINYGDYPRPVLHENRFYDDSPNRSTLIDGYVGYQYTFNTDTRLMLTYGYAHRDHHRDSYAYALDRMADQGVFGTLPEGYLSMMDASQSYRSHTVENTHSIGLQFSHWSDALSVFLTPTVKIADRDFDYFRNNTDYRIDKKHVLVSMPQFEGRITWRLGKYSHNGRKVWRHQLVFLPCIESVMPDLVKMVDIVDDTDPMNIWTGNPGLKPSVKYKGFLQWIISVPIGQYFMRNLTEFVYSDTHNELVNGYRYDTATGVRTYRTYNVGSGNSSTNFHVNPSLQFGNKGQFTVELFAGLDYIRAADMIGFDADPVKSQVHTYWSVEKLNFSWQLGKQKLGLRGEINSRHTGSDRPGFSPITGTNTNISASGQFSLPKGFGISTDFTVYMRRGYGSPELDKTEPVFNARLSYTPPKSRWVIMLDGFDLFHQLSNVTYATNAQGRTVVWNNVLPRYLLLHVQYRLNIQPKKKIIDTRPEWAR